MKNSTFQISVIRRISLRLFGPLLKTGSPLMKNVLRPLAKRVLVLLGLIAAASETDAAIQKKIMVPEPQH